MAEENVAGATETPEQKETVKTQAELNAGSGQTDYEKLIAEQNAKIERLSKDNDSYKQGIKKWQKVAKETNPFDSASFDDEKIESLIDQKVKEKIAESQLAQAIQERDNLISKMAKENSELKIALKNQPGSPTGSGTNQDKLEVKTEFFTKEQLEELKVRGVDPQKVIENYRKIKKF